jgi:hypothetical protein
MIKREWVGHSEPLDNIAGLTIIEWSMKDRMKYALGLGLFFRTRK